MVQLIIRRRCARSHSPKMIDSQNGKGKKGSHCAHRHSRGPWDTHASIRPVRIKWKQCEFLKATLTHTYTQTKSVLWCFFFWCRRFLSLLTQWVRDGRADRPSRSLPSIINLNAFLKVCYGPSHALLIHCIHCRLLGSEKQAKFERNLFCERKVLNGPINN